MEYVDARRLPGPGLLWDLPGTVLEVRCDPAAVPQLVEDWSRHVRAMLEAVGWADAPTVTHTLSGGVALAFAAPIDALYAATEINEWAWRCCVGEADPEAFEAAAEGFRSAIHQESNPRLLELRDAAAAHDVAFLWDDDEISIGLGAGSRTWPVDALPAPDEVEWARLHDVPFGLVTGTNGKTTTVRLASHIAQTAGRTVGLSSTDWIAVNDEVIDRDDWSGPGGARAVLRRGEVDLGILETARGGLLRRGLGVEHADAALITNIAEDHLGDFGSQSLEELLDIKWVVSRAVRQSGVLILNADDPRLVAKAAEYPGTIHWFSLDADNPVVQASVAGGGVAWVERAGDLVRLGSSEAQTVCPVADAPITLGGAARHNVANALAASALTHALGVPMQAIRDGLASMTQDANPGRCNVYDVDGVSVLVDFAHNPHAMRALFDMARALPAKRRLLAFAQAGDRTDASIRELAAEAWSIGLDAVIVSELAAYSRGRDEGEVYELIRDALVECGAVTAQIRHFMEETESLDAALQWAEPGDLVIMLALGARREIQERLQALASS